MTLNSGIGKSGLALAALVAFAMCILSFIFHPVEIPHIQYGLCLPSPDSWGFNPVWSWIVNTFLIALIAILLFLVNKTYNFIRTTEPAAEAIFLIMAASGPWFTQELNTSVILCLANIVCMGIMFDSYSARNATQEMFIIGVVVGIGSMVQYAFLPLAIVYFLWALFLKVLRAKEILAFISGIICPYWIALGTGWMDFGQIHFPSITPLFTYRQDPSEFILLLTSIALAASIGFIVTFVNSIKLYAGNSKVNAMNLCVSAMGAFSVICVLIDFDNMPSYVVTLFMACSMHLANICAVWNPRKPWVVTVAPSVLFLAIFVCSIVL